jgi:hypothetical protein
VLKKRGVSSEMEEIKRMGDLEDYRRKNSKYKNMITK